MFKLKKEKKRKREEPTALSLYIFFLIKEFGMGFCLNALIIRSFSFLNSD